MGTWDAPGTVPAVSALISSRRRQILYAAIGIMVLLWVLLTGRPPRPTMLWHEIYNLGHIPLFGLFAVLALEISRAGVGRSFDWPLAHYAIALGATAVVSVATELLQLDMPGRQAEVQDALHNIIGGSCFLALRACLDTALWSPDKSRLRRWVAVAAALTLLVSFWPLANLGWHYGMRSAAFPVLVDFDSRWQRPFLSSPRAGLDRMQAPAGWTQRKNQRIVAIKFMAAPWPGVSMHEPYPDWSGFKTLRFDVYSELPEAVDLILRIDDIQHNNQYRDRFNRTFTVQPGLTQISVALSDIRNAPSGRELNLQEITQMILFSRRPEEPFTLYFSDIWLE